MAKLTAKNTNITASPEVPNKGAKVPSKTRKHFDSYTDMGNHWLKASVQGYDLLREPSFYASCLESTSPNVKGHVKYLGGTRTDLIDKCWLVGREASRSGSADLMRLVDDYMGKSQLWLEYFLGLLAHLEVINTEQFHRVVVTCNDVERHEPIIRNMATGTHKVMLRGVLTTVTIDIVSVLPEGVAALKNHRLSGAVTVCDIGGGNVTISRFSGTELISEPIVKDFGCETLLQDLAGNSQLKTIIKQAPKLDTLNYSLEVGLKKVKGSEEFALFYGKSDIDILPAYKNVLSRFIDCRLREVIKLLDGYKLDGDTVLVIGGGSKLPLLSAALKKKGYTISSDGVFDNIKGLTKE
ncbi:hypothetical protein CAL7716_107580 (plasmid) [Calothrix sp. PCC 7716]|nr:hypothetical protein CAL7716_107580 [Calothrix sp. PCC 7716]